VIALEKNLWAGKLSIALGVLSLVSAIAVTREAVADAEMECKAAYCSDNCKKVGLGCSGTCTTTGANCNGCKSDGCEYLDAQNCICGEV